MTVKEWEMLRVLSYRHLHPEISLEEAEKKLADPTAFVGDLANWSTPLYREFNRRAKLHLQKHYRSRATDIVCLPFGPAHEEAFEGLDVVKVETGIGYNNAKHDFRIYESYAVLHTDIQRSEKQPPNYWFVAPNYYNLAEWARKGDTVQDKQAGDIDRPRIGFFGRIGNLKGCHVIAEVAKRFPHVDFILCGQGDPAPYVCENVIYKPPIHGHERASYLSSLTALIAPSSFIEPFCGANVEAQLCGTPVIGPEHGAFTETVEPFKTGLLCHTLQDYCRGVQMALDGKFDREYIARRAASRYDMFVVARRYEYIFRSILDIYNGNNGWYSPESYIDVLE